MKYYKKTKKFIKKNNKNYTKKRKKVNNKKKSKKIKYNIKRGGFFNFKNPFTRKKQNYDAPATEDVKKEYPVLTIGDEYKKNKFNYRASSSVHPKDYIIIQEHQIGTDIQNGEYCNTTANCQDIDNWKKISRNIETKNDINITAENANNTCTKIKNNFKDTCNNLLKNPVKNNIFNKKKFIAYKKKMDECNEKKQLIDIFEETKLHKDVNNLINCKLESKCQVNDNNCNRCPDKEDKEQYDKIIETLTQFNTTCKGFKYLNNESIDI